MWNDINDDVSPKVLDTILQQYKLCVEMAEQISSRRAAANAFFLTLNSTIISLTVGAITSKDFTVSVISALFIAILGFVLCYIWYRLILSYRQLNTAKFKVIGELEKRLPASPFYLAEWKLLGEGKDKKLYTPLSAIETNVPLVFSIIYLLLFTLTL